VTKRLDRSAFTTERSQVSLGTSAPNRRILRGDPGETREFIAIATTEAVPATPERWASYTGATNTIGAWARALAQTYVTRSEDVDMEMYIVMCKIVGHSNGAPLRSYANPHNFLSKCTDDIGGYDPLQAMLLKCMLSAPKIDPFNAPREGDVLSISVKYDRFGELDIESGRVLSRRRAVRGGWAMASKSCRESTESLSDLF
jgi:hypothetical protein